MAIGTERTTPAGPGGTNGGDVDHGGVGEVDGEVDGEVLPWYHSIVNVVVVAIAIALLAGGAGYVVGNNRALPDPNDTDIGFLQDMRFHHEQAVEMSMILLAIPDTHPGLRTVAREIVVGQAQEIGRMIQLLRQYGESEINETDVAMAWMGAPVPLERMPGLATPDQLAQLRAARGDTADRVFVDLMVAHHEGGIHMAEHARQHGGTEEVREFAASIADGQADEIAELRGLVGASGEA